MAIEITATVFINDSKKLDFGWVLKAAHPHRYKSEDGDWSTASTSYIDIIIRNNKIEEFSELTSLPSGTRINVTGYGKPTAFIKKDGTAGSSLQIEPTEYEVLEASQPKEEAPF